MVDRNVVIRHSILSEIQLLHFLDLYDSFQSNTDILVSYLNRIKQNNFYRLSI